MTTFYRYTDTFSWNYHLQYPDVTIHEDKYYLVKETPCGYWISSDKFYNERHINFFPDDKRWVSKTSRKRFAYPTKKEAMESFLARKCRQVSILTKQLMAAKEALVEAGKMEEKL